MWEHNLNHFYNASVFSQSFHLGVQLMLDFFSCLPSSLVRGPSPAPWQRLPLLRRSPPLVTDTAGERRPPLILLLPALASLCHFCQDQSVPLCSWILLRGMETCTALPQFPGATADQLPPAFSSLSILGCWVQNQVCLTMSLDFITLSFPFTLPASWLEMPPGLLWLLRVVCLELEEQGAVSFRAVTEAAAAAR